MNDWQVEKINAFLTPSYNPRDVLEMNMRLKNDANKRNHKTEHLFLI